MFDQNVAGGLKRFCTRLLPMLFIATASLCSCGGGGSAGGPLGDLFSLSTSGDAFSLSANSISFSAVEGGATPESQPVAININRGTVFISSSQTGSQFAHAVNVIAPTQGVILISALPPSTVGIGTFTGSITVRGCSTINCTTGDVAGSPKTINVSYTVAPFRTLAVTPTTVDFRTSVGIAPAPKTLDLSLNAGPASWTSQIDYTTPTTGWLTATPATSGTLPQKIMLSVSSIPTAGTYGATVTFSTAGASKVVPVSITVHAPAVNFVAPYVARVRVADNVIIRGYGFTASGLQVSFGGTPATSMTYVSDTEIHATHPALPAGSYLVIVGNGGATLPTRARLVVVEPPTFPPTTITRSVVPNSLTDLVYDAERRALYLMDGLNNRIERYRFNGAAWVSDALDEAIDPVLGGYGKIALSPDGTQLLKTSSTGLSIVNLATFNFVSAPSPLPLLRGLIRIAFANDGGAVSTSFDVMGPRASLYRYDMLNGQLTELSTQADMPSRLILASGNGAVLLLPSMAPVDRFLTYSVFAYSSSNGLLTKSSTVTANTVHGSLSRQGSRILMTGFGSDYAPLLPTVFDSSLMALGALPDSAASFVISPDGATAFACYVDLASSSGSGSGTIRKFNLNDPISGGFTEIGSGTLTPGGSCGQMAMSPDGGTLFLAGNERIVILPAP